MLCALSAHGLGAGRHLCRIGAATLDAMEGSQTAEGHGRLMGFRVARSALKVGRIATYRAGLGPESWWYALCATLVGNRREPSGESRIILVEAIGGQNAGHRDIDL